MTSSPRKYHYQRFAVCAVVCSLIVASAALLRDGSSSDPSDAPAGTTNANMTLDTELWRLARHKNSAPPLTLADREYKACPARQRVGDGARAAIKEGEEEAAWIANRSRLAEVAKTKNLRYFRAADMVVMTISKGGTIATMQALYQATTGRSLRDNLCKGPPQFMQSPCWKPHASYVSYLSRREQAHVLLSPRVFRLAVQVHPFHRLVSAFKSKFACRDAGFITDHGDVKRIVPRFRKDAKLPKVEESCMNISEFALALDRVRKNVGKPGFPASLQNIDVHLRPQEFFFGDIPYDMVVDVKDLGNARVMAPIAQRFKFGQNMSENGIAKVHDTGSASLTIPDIAASRIHSFAVLSKVGKLKYMEGHEPLAFAE